MDTIKSLNGEMIKGGWVSPPNVRYSGKDYLTEESFFTLKESGINLIHCMIDPIMDFEDVLKFIDLCEKFDIYVIISEEDFGNSDFDSNGFLSRLTEYKTRKCVLGINPGDEPNYEKLKNYKKNISLIYNQLGDLRVFLNNFPLYVSYCGLFGGIKKPTDGEVSMTKYVDFIEEFCKTVPFDILSYDFYPFTHEKGVCHPKYFYQLILSKQLADKYNKPLWNFTQVTSWQRATIRNMSYSEIEWMNNTSIACGITGIQYFCYWTPNSDEKEKFENAMISESGEKTQWYYFVKKANAKLKRIEDVILQSDYKGTIAQGNTLGYFPDEYNLKTFGKIKQIKSDGVLIGCFENNSKKLIYVVNTSVVETRLIKIIFEESVCLQVIDENQDYVFEGNEVSLVIHEGESVLLTEK